MLVGVYDYAEIHTIDSHIFTADLYSALQIARFQLGASAFNGIERAL